MGSGGVGILRLLCMNAVLCCGVGGLGVECWGRVRVESIPGDGSEIVGLRIECMRQLSLDLGESTAFKRQRQTNSHHFCLS